MIHLSFKLKYFALDEMVSGFGLNVVAVISTHSIQFVRAQLRQDESA